MKKLLKYGVASLTLATLGVMAEVADVPVISSKTVQASHVSGAGPSLYDILYFHGSLTSQNSTTEIALGIKQLQELEQRLLDSQKYTQGELTDLVTNGKLPKGTFDPVAFEQEKAVKLAAIAQSILDNEAAIASQREQLERLRIEANASSEPILFADSIRQEEEKLASLLRKADNLLDEQKSVSSRTVTYVGPYPELSVKERAQREMEDYLAAVNKDLKRIEEESERLKAAYAVALQREQGTTTTPAAAATSLTSSTNPVTVTIDAADAGKITSITTEAVTDAATLSKLPAAIKPANVALYDIKVLDANKQVTQISEPAQVTLAIDPSRRVLKVIYFLPETGATEDLKFEVSADGRSVSFTVLHFSQYGVVYADQTSTGTNQSTPTELTSPTVSTDKTTALQVTSVVAAAGTPASTTKPASAPQTSKSATPASASLPKTGEDKAMAATALGVTLILSSLGLAKARKTN